MEKEGEDGVIGFPFHILQEHAPKPAFGAPCNNCGLCCRVQPCHVSLHILHSDQVPCIALEVHDGKFLCGVARDPAKYLPEVSQMGLEVAHVREVLGELLGFNQGCGMDDEVLLVRIDEAS